MRKPLVSIVIPAYNEEKDIVNCINSLNKQSFKNFEIIIIDDGSTDKTLKIIKNFNKLKILKQNHQGPGKARNLGVKNAKGKILVFIDADMTFEKNYIKNLIEPLKNKKVIGTTHDYELAVNTENKWSFLWGKIRVSKSNAKDVKIFRAIKKDNFTELGGFDSKYGYADDQTFWFKYKIKPIVAKDTTCYHRNPSSLKGTFKQARWIGASWKERYAFFRIPLLANLLVVGLFLILPLLILGKSVKTKVYSKINFLDIIKFYSAKFFGYSIGIFRAIYLNKVWK